MTRVPRPIAGRDIRSLPLRPVEGFLLSRIDAATDEQELSMLTGLSAPEVEAALNRLFDLGVIDFVRGSRGGGAGAAPPSTALAPPVGPRAAEDARASAPTLSSGTSSASVVSPRLYDPADLDEDVELDRDRRRRILDTFHRLDDLTYYELLRVDRTADKKRIKSAYYELAPEFHTDTYFRKRLGSYKAKIEGIFSRLTVAHDVLTHRERRAEYDTYLDQVEKNRAMAAWMESAPSSGLPLQASAATVRVSVSVTAADSPASEPPGRPPPDSEQAAESERSRRQTLARKLSGGFRRVSSGVIPAVTIASQPPPPPSSGSGGPLSPPPADRTTSSTRKGPLERWLDLATDAEARGDIAGAADALCAALALAPGDAALNKRSEEAQRRAEIELARGYLRQGDYEAGEGRWTEAAWSYAKACSVLPGDAGAHERVAFATLKTGGSSRRAVEFARRAVEIEPAIALNRLTLARAYFAAGLEKSARGELDRATALAPGDAEIKRCIDEILEHARRHGKVG